MVKITSIYICIYTSNFTNFLNFSMSYIVCSVYSSRLLVMDRDTVLGSVSSPLYVCETWKMVCSQTQLCHYRTSYMPSTPPQ